MPAVESLSDAVLTSSSLTPRLFTSHLIASRRLASLILCGLLASLALAPRVALAQGGGNTLWGDVRVDESKSDGQHALSFDIILYTEARNIVARQTVSNHGRYQFLDLANGNYDVAVEYEGAEITRLRVRVFSNFKTDFHQDIELQLRARPTNAKPGSVSAVDFYKRTSANQKLYDRAEEAMAAKKYADAAALLQQLVAADAQDYQSWTELGTAYLLQNEATQSEKSYLRAIEVRPTFALAYLDLARLRMAQKNYDSAIETLTKAVVLQPSSADANFLLGESYLQIKKGSKAVSYLEEAARLGRTDAHLRLATLYNAAGLKDRAALEYEQFLAKTPNYPDRKKLEDYIKDNKKR